MSGAAGSALALIAAPGLATAAQGGLRPGTVYNGVIRVEGGQVSLVVGGNALALQTSAPLLDGQAVLAQLLRTPAGLQVRLTLPTPASPGNQTGQGAQPNAAMPAGAPPANPMTPEAQAAAPKPQPQGARTGAPSQRAAAPAPSAAPANKPASMLPNQTTPATPPSPTAADAARLARVTAEVARSLPPETAPERLATLLPRQTPPAEGIVRAALQVLAARDAAGADLATLVRGFALGADRGIIPAQQAAFVLAFEVADPERADAWTPVIRRWLEAASKPLEARLATAVRGGAGAGIDLGQELRSTLIAARGDAALARLLQREGDLDPFRQALDRIVDRLTGTQVNNLRGFDGPYLFAELPGGEAFERAQLHIMGDEASPERRAPSRQVVLDVAMQRLGALWIALSVANTRCQCTLRVADAAVLPEVTAAAPELAAALAEAGYPGAEVRVAGWDGDRVAALAGVLARRDRLDLEA